jgi:BASS family bile acid:Na+ symporter
MLTQITRLFPLWAIMLSSIAYFFPEVFLPLKPTIVPLLGLVMFGMGMTLTPANFLEVLRRPTIIGFGIFLQFLIMPAVAWFLAQAMNLSPQLAAGLILVGSCPGGTASNVVCYLAKGDVALSITLTSLSTLLAVLATPVLTWLYVGERVPVPVASMLLSVLKIVILPVVLGLVVNRIFGVYLGQLKRVFPLLSVVAIVVIIAIIVALNQPQMGLLAPTIVIAVVLHNGLGLLSGYWFSRWVGFDKRTCRTLAIEVGMQNSGLGVALAIKYFSASAALPGALFSIWHNLSGSFLAAYWARRIPLYETNGAATQFK